MSTYFFIPTLCSCQVRMEIEHACWIVETGSWLFIVTFLSFYLVGRSVYTFLDVLITDTLLGLIYKNLRNKHIFFPNFSDIFMLVIPSGKRITSIIASHYLLSSYCVLNVGQKHLMSWSLIMEALWGRYYNVSFYSPERLHG